MEELPDVKTVVTPQQMATAICYAYYRYFNSWPRRDSVRILLAQWALETGWGKSMHCYNIGNVKSKKGDGYDYCFFACNELLSKSVAEFFKVKDPNLVKVTSYRSDGLCVVWFYPNHPSCRFRAFKTLEDGVYDYLLLLVQRFTKAWHCVASGDPVEFSRALKQQKYYTADEASYTRTLKSIFDKLECIELPERQPITDKEREEAMNRMVLSLREIAEESIYGPD